MPASDEYGGEFVPNPAAALYTCTAEARLSDGRTVPLGGRTTNCASAALVWLGWRAGHIAEQLDVPVARPLWAWRADADEHALALERLARGLTYVSMVRDEGTTYLLTARPAAHQEAACHG